MSVSSSISGGGFGSSGAGVSGLSTADGGTALADNKVVRGDGTTGIQGSVVVIDDAGAVSGATQLTVDNIDIDGNTISSINANGTIALATGQVTLPNGSMSAPALALTSAPAGPGIGATPAGFGLIHSSTVYTDPRSAALVVRNSATGAQGGIAAVVPTATVPNFCPDVIGDNNTGLGSAGGDKISVIAGGSEIVRGEFSGAAAKIGFLAKAAAPAGAQSGGAATAGATYDAATQAMVQAAYDCLRAFGLLT